MSKKKGRGAFSTNHPLGILDSRYLSEKEHILAYWEAQTKKDMDEEKENE